MGSATARSRSWAFGRSSRTTISRPLFRNAISRIREAMVSYEKSVLSKMSSLAQNVVVVPVSSVASCRWSGPVGTP